MRRILFLFCAFLLFAFSGSTWAEDFPVLRDYDGIEIPKGSFVPVINTQEISTVYCDEGTKVKFISTTDLFLYETNVIPRETEFYGFVEKVNEPVVGTNGSLIIKINKLKLPDGFEIPLKGYIYTSNNNLLGGEMTAPKSYDKMPHYQSGLSIGTIQFVPGAERRMGEHTVIAAGADMMVILTAPLFITHTVTN